MTTPELLNLALNLLVVPLFGWGIKLSAKVLRIETKMESFAEFHDHIKEQREINASLATSIALLQQSLARLEEK